MIQLASLLAIPRISKQEFSLFLRHEFRGYPNHLEELENECLPDREFSKCITRARVEENSKRELSEKFCWPTNKWRGSKIKRRSLSTALPVLLTYLRPLLFSLRSRPFLLGRTNSTRFPVS